MCSAGSSHQHGVHPDRRCTLDIAQLVVSDEHRTVRGDAEACQRLEERRRVGFPPAGPTLVGKDHGVHQCVDAKRLDFTPLQIGYPVGNDTKPPPFTQLRENQF